MILIFMAILVALVASAFMLSYSDEGNSTIHMLSGIFGFLLSIAVGITSIFYCFTLWSWIASEHKAAIINREYGTNYTREEIFYASDSIETIRALDRKRYEINGNLMNNK